MAADGARALGRPLLRATAHDRGRDASVAPAAAHAMRAVLLPRGQVRRRSGAASALPQRLAIASSLSVHQRAAMASTSPPLPPVRLAKPLRVAVLNSPGNDPYAPMFACLLASALDAESLPLLSVESFETEARQLPPHGAFDGYVLSGSRHGAYEKLPWIEELLAWTREAVARRDRLLGVCFGHQVIAQALGGNVTPNAAGFEIGGLGLELTPQARAYFATLLGSDDAVPAGVHMLYVHGCGCYAPLRHAHLRLLTWRAAGTRSLRCRRGSSRSVAVPLAPSTA